VRIDPAIRDTLAPADRALLDYYCEGLRLDPAWQEPLAAMFWVHHIAYRVRIDASLRSWREEVRESIEGIAARLVTSLPAARAHGH
jgi:hypothetical protein